MTPLARLASLFPAIASFHFGGCQPTKPATTVPASSVRSGEHAIAIPQRGSPEWNRLVSRRLGVIDESGHGPDIGSGEWLSAVDRKSGVSDAQGHGPDLGGDEWQRAVDYKVFGRR